MQSTLRLLRLIAGAQADQRREVLEALLDAFGGEPGGLSLVPDCFDSGLLSLEEIQAALPTLYPRALVEDSVAAAIHRGAALMSHGEWTELVGLPREDAAGSAAAQPCQPSRRLLWSSARKWPSTARRRRTLQRFLQKYFKGVKSIAITNE